MAVHEVRLGRRRVVTLVGDPRHYPALVRSLDTATPRRRAVRWALTVLTTVRAIRAVARPAAEDPEVARLLEVVRGAVGEDPAAAMVVWPGGDRLHRRYVVVSDATGRLRAFAKVSTRPDLDAASFLAERTVLQELQRSPLPAVRTPRVLGAHDTLDLTALVLEAIPASREHLSWDEVTALLPLQPTSPAAGQGPHPWVRSCDRLSASSSFAGAVEAALPSLRTSTANGDIRPSNVVRSEGEVWVFDWEYGSTTAPFGTDLVSALLTRRVESEPSPDPESVTVDLLSALREREVTESEAALAVLYLASTGQPWANALVQGRWPAPRTPGRRTPSS